jgi:hypothetical protein
MATVSSSTLLAYTQEYVDAVFKDRLLQEGFVNPDGNGITWYRIVNHEIINSICFYTRWNSTPVILDIGYGIHPLFIEPFRPTKVYLYSLPFNWERSFDQHLVCREGTFGMAPFSPAIPVMVPSGKDKGLHTLEGIMLPEMNKVKTIHECYAFHKSRYQSITRCTLAQALNACSADFIDEGILVEDTALYPHFQAIIEKGLAHAENFDEKHLRKKDTKQWILQTQLQAEALIKGNRQVFLDSLEQRKENVIKLIEKKMQITI